MTNVFGTVLNHWLRSSKKHFLEGLGAFAACAQGAYLDYVGAPQAQTATARWGKENPMAAGYQAGA